MKKDIKDFLHLYYGQKVKAKYEYNMGDFCFTKGGEWQMTLEELRHFLGCREVPVKLLLRPLSGMTKKEFEYKNSICFYQELPAKTEDGKSAAVIHDSPQSFLWMLKQGFDLFGLIEAGLAIDKTTLTNKS